MLDTANINETKTTQCFDDSFNQATTYVGIYNRNVPVLKIDPSTNEKEIEISEGQLGINGWTAYSHGSRGLTIKPMMQNPKQAPSI